MAAQADEPDHQPVGVGPDQHRAGGRRGLEPCGGVHGVAGDQRLVDRELVGDHLAGVHADPDPELDAVVGLELAVQGDDRLAHAERRPAPPAARRPRAAPAPRTPP